MTVIRAFQDYELKRMSEQGFQLAGWKTYEESPYREYERRMELLGYEKRVRAGSDTANTRQTVAR